jgi:hypothetical protein
MVRFGLFVTGISKPSFLQPALENKRKVAVISVNKNVFFMIIGFSFFTYSVWGLSADRQAFRYPPVLQQYINRQKILLPLLERYFFN